MYHFYNQYPAEDVSSFGSYNKSLNLSLQPKLSLLFFHSVSPNQVNRFRTDEDSSHFRPKPIPSSVTAVTFTRMSFSKDDVHLPGTPSSAGFLSSEFP